MSGIHFFGKVDRNRDGKIKSQYPAWTMPVQEQELAENVASMEEELERGVPFEVRAKRKETLKLHKDRLKAIRSSKPKLTGPQTDKVAKAYKEIGEGIKDSMFTYSQMQRGTADAHEEARRMSSSCIKVDPELAEACGVKVGENGKVGRNAAAKMFKIMGRYLGEITNTEALRRRG